MVNKHRHSQKATMAKDISPVRNGVAGFSKYASSPQSVGSGFGSRLTLAMANNASAAAGNSNSNASPWKYNTMVSQQREQFNNLHFC